MISHMASIVLLGSLYSSAVAGADDAARAAAMAPGFTRCAGVYDAVAVFGQAIGRSANSRMMASRALDAERAATALLAVSGTPKDQAEATAREERMSQAFYQIALLRTGDAEPLVNALRQCTEDYLPVQNALLSAVRAYAARGERDPALWSRAIIDAISQKPEAMEEAPP